MITNSTKRSIYYQIPFLKMIKTSIEKEIVIIIIIND